MVIRVSKRTVSPLTAMYNNYFQLPKPTPDKLVCTIDHLLSKKDGASDSLYEHELDSQRVFEQRATQYKCIIKLLLLVIINIGKVKWNN